RISAFARSMFIDRPSEHACKKYEGDDCGNAYRQRGQLFLNVVPVHILNDKQPKPAKHMNGEEENKQCFSPLYEWLLGPAKKSVKPFAIADSKAQHKEVQRQERRQRKA